MRAIVMTILVFMLPMALADSIETSFPKGSGAKFKISSKQMGDVETKIYIVGASPSQVSVEMFMSSPGFESLVQVWQRFDLVRTGAGFEIKQGLLQNSQMKKPQRMPSSLLDGRDGVLTADFMFKDKSSIESLKVGEELVMVEGHKIKATHYRQSRNGQEIHFWLSDQAKPLGLVKLVSSGPKPKHNYSMQIKALLTNVRGRIDPSVAVDMDPETKALLKHSVHPVSNEL